MTDGKFATQDDVTSRFEGQFPSDRLDWVSVRITDVENALMGAVPSLRKPLADITADSVAAGDPDRAARVTTLVANKVLDLYRNPDGASQTTTTTPDITLARSLGSDGTRGRVAFTPAELDSVRLRTQRTKFGTFTVTPGRITQPPCDY